MSSPLLFNHSLEGSYPAAELADIKGIPLYMTRAYALTRPDDYIQLPNEAFSNHSSILAHYQNIGLEVTKNIIWDHRLAWIDEFPNYEWDVFLYSDEHYKVKQDPRRRAVVALANNKNYFLGLCIKYNVPMPNTDFLDYTGGECTVRPKKFPCFVKKAISASGAGVFKIENSEQFDTLLAEQGSGSYQIQEAVEGDVDFWNVQYAPDGDKARMLTATKQILDGFAHNGNIFSPNPPECLNIGDGIANILVQMGMKGIFAFDIAVSNGKAYMIECNPRPNGCTYFSETAKRLNAPFWFSKNIRTKPSVDSIDKIDFQNLSYRNGRGVVLINWGTVSMNKLGVLFAGKDENDANDVLREFSSLNC